MHIDSLPQHGISELTDIGRPNSEWPDNGGPITHSGSASKSRTIVYTALVFIVALIFYSASLGNRPFFTRGEGREALVVRDMIAQHNLVLPFQDLSDIPTKPPMLHWLAVLTAKLTGGMSEWSIRFPSALCAAFTLAALYLFVARSLSKRTALLSILVLASSIEFARSATHARVDMNFCCWLTIGLLSIYQLLGAWRRNESSSPLFWVTATVSLALAILSKGPAGVILPWLIAALYVVAVCLIEKRPLPFQRLLAPTVISIVATSALAGLWYYLAYLQGGDAFMHVHLFKENIGRFTLIEGKDQGHIKPFYYSVIYLLIGFMPWSLMLPVAGIWLWRNRSLLSDRRQDFLLFSLLWTAAVIALITVSKAKRDVYLLPAFPPLAFLLCYSLENFTVGECVRCKFKLVAGICLAVVGLLLTAGALALCGLLLSDTLAATLLGRLKGDALLLFPQLLSAIRESLWVVLLAFIGSGALLLSSRDLLKGAYAKSIINITASALILNFVANSLVYPVAARLDSPKEFISEVKKIVPGEVRLLQYENQFFPAMYYADRRVSMTFSLDEFNAAAPAYILVREGDLAEVLRGSPGAAVVIVSSTNAANGDERLYLVKNRTA